MAIVTASAKLYQGIRCYVVDKNISATLTATFTIGNQNQPSPILDGNGNIILQSGVKVFKIVRTIADLLCPRPKPSLVNEKYKTYGGGNNVINADGSVDNTNNSKITATLTCQFPTYFRLDPKTLGLPEGQDCIIMLEEGFVYENQGTTATNKAAYPTLLSTPSPRNDSFVSFRTPKTLSKTLTNIVSTVYAFTGRIRPFASNISSAMAFTVKTTYQRAGAIILTGGAGFILPIAVKTARLSQNLTAVSTIITDNRRVRPFDAAAYTITASLNHQSATARFRQGQADAPVATFITASGDRTLGPITASITATATLGCDIGKIMGIIETTPVVSSLSFTPTKTTRIQQSLVAQASLSGDGSIPMVFTWTTTQPNQSMGIPIYFGNINAKIDWGDGQTQTVTQVPTWLGYTGGTSISNAGIRHTYATIGTYTVTISGYVQNFGFTNPGQFADVRDLNTFKYQRYRMSIQTWGYLGIETLVAAHIDIMYEKPLGSRDVPSRLPETVVNTSYMFKHTYADDQMWGTSLNNIVSGWNVSNVRNMSQMFFRVRGGANGAIPFNPDLSSWNVSSVQDFSNMFYFASNFAGIGLQNWDVSSATNMSGMFYSSGFSNDLPNWDVSNVTNFQGMFAYSNTTYYAEITNNRKETIRLWNWDLSSASYNGVELMLYGAGGNTLNDYRWHSDLSYWCVPNTLSLTNFWYPPSSVFEANAITPRWGTCPTRPRPIVSSVSFDDTVVNEGQTITMTVNVSNIANTVVYYRMNFNYTGNWEFANSYGTSYSENTGNTAPNDVNRFTGSINIVNGVGTLTIYINPNNDWVEYTEYFRVDILSQDGYFTPNNSNPLLLAQSPIVTILP